MGRQREYKPLSRDDIRLICECKIERAKLREEAAAMTKADRFAYRALIERCKKEARELSDQNLAEKFNTSKYQIWLL